MKEIIFLVGLTAVGKTSAVSALKANDYKLLPNRRELTDLIIIPKVQEDLGLPQKPVKDRIKRFELTAKYRESHSAGIVWALRKYLKNLPDGKYIFDNIRGKNELEAAASSFRGARFIFLDADFRVRLKRLIKRKDNFDSVEQKAGLQTNLLANLSQIENANELFDLEALMNKAYEEKSLLAAVKIISTEHKNYNSKEAKEFLKTLQAASYLYIDTGRNTIEEVSEKIGRFLNA